MAEPRSEFRNDSPGVCGVVVLREGKPHGTFVRPGETIWLTEAEQVETANAPRRDEDNPFKDGTLSLVTASTEIANRRPIGDSQSPQVPESEEAQQEAARRTAETRKAAEAQKAEEERLEKARAQAKQPGQPIQDPPSVPSQSGVPAPAKPATPVGG